MKLEVGKLYRTRDGQKAEVVYIDETLAKHCQAYARVGDRETLTGYHITGAYAYYGTRTLDLIEGWEEPKKVKYLKSIKQILEENPGACFSRYGSLYNVGNSIITSEMFIYFDKPLENVSGK